jgi:hypothetical protein
VRDVSFGTEGEDDWVIVDYSLDIEAALKCVVKAVGDGSCVIKFR